MLQADVYQSVDDGGVVHLTNVPSEPHYQILLHVSFDVLGKIEDEKSSSGQEKQIFPYAALIRKAAQEQNLDQALLRAIITVESANNPHAVSSEGAVGLMQLMPDTAHRYGVLDRFDPGENIRAGAKYLHDLILLFHDDLPLALAAYNAGEDAVENHGNQIPPYPETREYVPRVMSLYKKYRMESLEAGIAK